MFSRLFKRRQEDFVCGHCGAHVQGNGYTNHCPACLWSKHVDINPGDRGEQCGGLMEPVSADLVKGEWVLFQRCQRCGLARRNRSTPGDNAEMIVQLSARPTP